MNPILQALQRKQDAQQQPAPSSPTSIDQLINGIKTGQVDAKAEVLKILGSDPAKREYIKKNLPLLSGLAKKLGVPDAEVNAFTAAVKL